MAGGYADTAPYTRACLTPSPHPLPAQTRTIKLCTKQRKSTNSWCSAARTGLSWRSTTACEPSGAASPERWSPATGRKCSRSAHSGPVQCDRSDLLPRKSLQGRGNTDGGAAVPRRGAARAVGIQSNLHERLYFHDKLSSEKLPSRRRLELDGAIPMNADPSSRASSTASSGQSSK